MFRIKRVYDRPKATDGVRILVDRLWPRGLPKEEAKVDLWMKDVAPSTGLRTWYGHDTTKWDDFVQRYVAELTDNPGVQGLRQMGRGKTVTLLYASYDDEHNNAIALRNYLRGVSPFAGKQGRKRRVQVAEPPSRAGRTARRSRHAKRATPSPRANVRTAARRGRKRREEALTPR